MQIKHHTISGHWFGHTPEKCESKKRCSTHKERSKERMNEKIHLWRRH
jgi:hypothetical protein